MGCGPSKWMKTGETATSLACPLLYSRGSVPLPNPDRQGVDPFFNGAVLNN